MGKCYPKVELEYIVFTGENHSEIEDFCEDSLFISENDLSLETHYGFVDLFEGCYIVSNIDNSYNVMTKEDFEHMYIYA